MPPFSKECPLRDHYSICWDFTRFLQDHPHHGHTLNGTELAKTLGLSRTTFQQRRQSRTAFSVFKAAHELLAPDVPEFVYAIEPVTHRGVPCSVSTLVMDLATKWDARHAGAKFSLRDGSVLEIGVTATPVGLPRKKRATRPLAVGEVLTAPAPATPPAPPAPPAPPQAQYARPTVAVAVPDTGVSYTTLKSMALALKTELLNELLARDAGVRLDIHTVVARKDVEIDILLHHLAKLGSELASERLLRESAGVRALSAEARANNADEMVAYLTEENEKLEAQVKERDTIINQQVQSLFSFSHKHPGQSQLSPELLARAREISREVAAELQIHSS